MDKEKPYKSQVAAKVVTLWLSAAVLMLSVVGTPHWALVYEGCPKLGRMVYSFFHANVFHAFVNVWTLLAVVFLSRVDIYAILAAYVAAVLIPIEWCVGYADAATCGLSVMVFFLLGSISYSVRKPLKYDLPIISFIIVGFFLPHVNAMAHVYAYVVGWVYGFLFTTLDGTGDS